MDSSIKRTGNACVNEMKIPKEKIMIIEKNHDTVLAHKKMDSIVPNNVFSNT